jgi:hypothetical protein
MRTQIPGLIKIGLQDFFKSTLFWIAGAGIFNFMLLDVCFPGGTESGEWRLYFLFPVLYICSLIFLFKKSTLFYASVKSVFIVLFIVVELYLYFHPVLMFCSTISFMILYFINQRELSSLQESNDAKVLPAYFVYLISTLASMKLFYWGDFNYFLGSEYSIGVTFIAFGMICFFNFKFDLKVPVFLKSPVKIVKVLVPVCVFILAGFRVYDMEMVQLHHWGCYVGPAELIRQGGYLLWNIPSQYGFLSILSIAVAPFASCWESFYFLQIIILLISATILFIVLSSSNSNPIFYFFSIILVLASIFLVPGDVSYLRGVSSYPSVGPYRFLWVYILLFFMVIQYRRNYLDEKREIIFGSLIWLLASWWSFESAYYVSLPWFGYLFIKSIRLDESNKLNYKRTIHVGLRNFLIPVLFLLASLAILSVFYLLSLRHLPDFFAYFEHALSFKNGFGSMLMKVNGGIGVIVFVLFFGACFIFESCVNFRKNQNYISIISASILSLYSCLSYFIGRSHENNLLNLIPIVVMAIAVISLLNTWQGHSFTSILFRYFSYPLYLVIILITIGNKTDFTHYLNDLKSGYRNIQNMNHAPPASLEELMISAGITEKDSIAFQANFMLVKYKNSERSFKHWLPFNPMTVLNPIKEERQKVYIKRFTAQFKSGGYFIRSKAYPDTLEKFIHQDYYIVGPEYENAEWRIIRFVRKGSE